VSAVSKTGSIVVRWLLVVVWMAVIFTASGDGQSYQHSSRIIAPLVKFLFPQISPATLDGIVLVCRKCAHLTEYAILAFLLWWAVRKPSGRNSWSWRDARLAGLLVALYAASDELHQTFVPSRDGCVRDVAIDTSGAILGIGAIWLFRKFRRNPTAAPKKAGTNACSGLCR
jgi:VanZ family protein